MDLGLEVSVGTSYKQIINLKTININLTISDNTQLCACVCMFVSEREGEEERRGPAFLCTVFK